MAKCLNTDFSASYAYKKGCRCNICVLLKKEYTRREAPKARERTRLWHKQHPGARAVYYKRYVDKTWLQKYGELQVKQKGLCAICNRSPRGMVRSRKRLVVDHCHTTGKIRGLLCGSCNVGLGHFEDNPVFLQNAIDYIAINGEVFN